MFLGLKTRSIAEFNVGEWPIALVVSNIAGDQISARRIGLVYGLDLDKSENRD